MKQKPLDRSPFEGQWRGDEDDAQILEYFLMIASDTVAVAQESAGNYVANVMDTSGDVPFTVQRVSKATGRVTSLTAQPSIDNTDPAAASTKSPNAKGFTLVPRAAGRVVLSLLDKLGTARGKLIVNVHATPPVVENPGTVTPTDPGTGGGTTEPTTPTDPTPTDPGTGGGTTDPGTGGGTTDPTTPVDPGIGGSTTPPTDPGTGGGTTTPVDPGTGGGTTDPGTGTTTPTEPGTGTGGGTTTPTDPGTGGGTTTPTTPTTPVKKPVLGFKVSVGVAPTKVGDNFELKVKLALGALTVTVTDDIGVADSDLKFEYASTGITVAVWSLVPPRSMKLLILGLGTATLTVTHVPTGVKTTLKITITLL